MRSSRFSKRLVESLRLPRLGGGVVETTGLTFDFDVVVGRSRVRFFGGVPLCVVCIFAAAFVEGFIFAAAFVVEGLVEEIIIQILI